MYAVITTGGKQYRVTEGQVLRFEKLEGEPSTTVEFDKVLMLGVGEDVRVGTPYLDGIKVMGEVLGQNRARKINILKFKRRKHHMKRMGHRQAYTEVKITAIGDRSEKVTMKSLAEKTVASKKVVAKKTANKE